MFEMAMFSWLTESCNTKWAFGSGEWPQREQPLPSLLLVGTQVNDTRSSNHSHCHPPLWGPRWTMPEEGGMSQTIWEGSENIRNTSDTGVHTVSNKVQWIYKGITIQQAGDWGLCRTSSHLRKNPELNQRHSWRTDFSERGLDTCGIVTY